MHRLGINSAGGQADPTFPVGHPWHLSLGRTGGDSVDGAGRQRWGWRSRKAPRPRSEQAALSVPGPQLASGPGRARSGLGRRCQGDPRWAGDRQRRRYHERPEAQLHLRCLWRVGAPLVCECMCSAGVLLGCGGLRGGEGCGGKRTSKSCAGLVSSRGAHELPRALLSVHVHMWE